MCQELLEILLEISHPPSFLTAAMKSVVNSLPKKSLSIAIKLDPDLLARLVQHLLRELYRPSS